MDVVTNARESLSQELNKWFWTSQRTEWDQKRSKLVKQMALQIETISEHQPAPNQLALQSTHAMLGSEAEKLAGLKREQCDFWDTIPLNITSAPKQSLP